MYSRRTGSLGENFWRRTRHSTHFSSLDGSAAKIIFPKSAQVSLLAGNLRSGGGPSSLLVKSRAAQAFELGRAGQEESTADLLNLLWEAFCNTRCHQELLVPLFIDSFSLTSLCIKLVRSTSKWKLCTCNFYSEFECVEE